MDDKGFDAALVTSALAIAGRDGWAAMTVWAAAREAGLDVSDARRRFPSKNAVLLRFGLMADAAAITEPPGFANEAPPESGVADSMTPVSAEPREKLFDIIMRRIDVLQTHRAGILAVFAALPSDPAIALMLAAASLNSMTWLLDAAGIPACGPWGTLRAQGLLAVWLWTIRAWQRDESADLAATMACLDTALTRAEQMARSLPGGL